MFSAFSTTRRTVLKGAVLVSAHVFLNLPLDSSKDLTDDQASPKPTFVMGDATYATVVCYDAEWKSQVVTSFPLRLGLSERVDPLVLNATWDERLFKVHGPALAIVLGEAREVTLELGKPGQFVAPVTPDLSELAFQVELLSAYPNENLDAVSPTRIWLTNEAGAAVAELVVDATVTYSAPWGVEILVDWVSYGKEVVPARIVLRSVGPNPAPAGLEIVACYADVLALPTVAIPGGADSAPASISGSSLGGVTDLRIVTLDALAATSEIELLFPSAASDSIPAAFGPQVPYVRLETPIEARNQRLSGRHESYPVTDSGSQLSTYMPEPSAG